MFEDNKVDIFMAYKKFRNHLFSISELFERVIFENIWHKILLMYTMECFTTWNKK